MAAAERDESFDAVVVGSGAGGGAAAYALCRAGWRVLVLEKGPALGPHEFVHRSLEYEAFAEWLTAGTHVTLDPEVKDRQGLPVARVSIEAHPATRAAVRFLAGRGRAVLQAAGASEVIDDVPVSPAARAGAYTFLQAGTARMGRKPDESVLDPGGQAHDVKNLYVADASGFPSAGGAPHTLTIMANALRIAAGIAGRGRAGPI